MTLLPSCSKKPEAPEPSATKVSSSATSQPPAPTPEKLNCPSSFDIPVKAADAPVDDLRGLRVGMSLAQTILYFKCKSPDITFNPPARQGQALNLNRAMNMRGVGLQRQNNEDLINSWSGFNFYGHKIQTEFHLRSPQLTYRILAFGDDGKEMVYGVWQEQDFESDKPAVDKTKADLIAKYGQPSSVEDDNSNEITLEWKYDPNNKKLSKTTEDFRTCRGSGDSWNEGCGLTIYAHLYRDFNNNLLARNMTVGVFQQGQYIADGLRYQEVWKKADAKKKQEEASKASTTGAKF
jgi:hypothetical protein